MSSRSADFWDSSKDGLMTGYQAGQSLDALAKIYQKSPSAIWRALQRWGVQIRRQKIHSCNEQAFDVITEESAYWIGFLMADGSIDDRRNATGNPVLRLSLSAKDALHIESFRAFLQASQQVRFSTGKSTFPDGTSMIAERAYLSITSKLLCNCLAQYGVVPRKNGGVIGLENDRHFWRGVIDGDGWVNWCKGHGKSPMPMLGVCGSKELMDQYASFVRPICGTARKPTLHRGTWQFPLFSQASCDVLRVLYNDCTIALPRKWVNAKDCMTYAMTRRRPSCRGL